MLRSLCLATGLLLGGLAPASAADKLSLLLEWYVNPVHAPLVIAQEKGFFAAHGLDVDMTPPSDPSAPPRLVAAGQADVTVHYQPNLYLDHENGLPLVRFGTLMETPLNTLTVLANGPIKTLADLKGKRIGFSVSGFETAMLNSFLKSAGLTANDVTLVNVNFSLTPSLISGSVDATVGSYRNFELAQMRLEGHEGHAYFPEEYGVPAYDELIFATRKDLVNDPRLPRFLAAVEDAAIYITNYPEESWKLFIKAYPDLDDALNRQAWIDTLPRFAKRPAALDATRYARFGKFMQDSGLIKQAPAVADIAVELGQ